MSSLVPQKYYDVENAPSQSSLAGYVAAALDGAFGQALESGISTLDFVTKRVGIATVASLPVEIRKDNDWWVINVGEISISVAATFALSQVIEKVAFSVAALILGVESLPIVATVAIGAAVSIGAAVVWNKFLDLGGQELIDTVLNSQTRDIVYEQYGRPLKGVIYDELRSDDDIRTALIDMTDHVNAVPGSTLKLMTSGELEREFAVISGQAVLDIAKSLGATIAEFDAWNWAKGANGSDASNIQLLTENDKLSLIIVDTAGELAVKIPDWSSTGGGMLNATVNLSGMKDGGPLYGHASDGTEIIIGISSDNIEYLTSTSGGGAVVIGGSGVDVITGSSGNDRLVGDSIDFGSEFGSGDTINGQGGNDEIYGGAGSDTIDGGEGDDRIYGGLDGDTLSGGAGNDVIFGDREVNHMAGEFAIGDKLYGNAGEDTLNGSDANDELNGGADRDQLYGGKGRDILYGNLDEGGGQDFVSDILRGEDDGDIYVLDSTGLFGIDNPSQEMDFYMEVHMYDTTISAKSTFKLADVIEDDGINDNIFVRDYGYLSHLIVQGVETVGDFDFYYTDTSIVYIRSGNDLCISEIYQKYTPLFVAGEAASEPPNWSGFDVIATVKDFFASSAARFSLAASNLPSAKYGVELTVAVTTYGDDDDNTILGEDAPNIVWSFDGKDIIETQNWNDRIYSGYGNDTVYSGGGHDYINAEEGNDLVDAGDGDDVVLGGGGDDILIGGDGDDSLDGGDGRDEIHGGAGDDIIDGGEGADDWVTYWDANGVTVNLTDGTATGQGIDTISNIENVWGSAGNDSLTGDGQDNELYGSDGNDFIWGVDGYNTMDGGTGDDDIVSGHGNDIIEGGEGVDTVEYWWSTGGVTVNLTAGTAHGDGDDTLSGIENVVGSSFGDTLTGNEFDNQLYGDAGNDALSGLAGNDYLNAGEGDDVLNGGVGLDYLVGGEGADTFRFDPNFGHDTVEDFSLGDVIEFASSVFADFGDVLSAATEVDGSTVIALDGDNSVTLQNVALASLSADEFRFAA